MGPATADYPKESLLYGAVPIVAVMPFVLAYNTNPQLQAARAQPHEEAKRGQIRQAIPMDGQGPQLQGDGVDLGVNQHGVASVWPCQARCLPWATGLNQSSSDKSRTAPLSAEVASKA